MALHLAYGNGLTPLKFNTAAPQENPADMARMQELQSAYDTYTRTEEYYNEAVQQYQSAEDDYNSRIRDLEAASASGDVNAVNAASTALQNSAQAYNNAVDTLKQRQTAYNSMLNQIANAGLISGDEARYYQQNNSVDRVDLSNVEALGGAVTKSAELRFNYSARADDVQKAADAYNELAAQYNSAASAEERAQLEAKLSDAIDTYNEAATQYNIAWQKGVQSGELSGGEKLEYLSKPVTPLPDADFTATTSAAIAAREKSMNPLAKIGEFADNLISGDTYRQLFGTPSYRKNAKPEMLRIPTKEQSAGVGILDAALLGVGLIPGGSFAKGANTISKAAETGSVVTGDILAVNTAAKVTPAAVKGTAAGKTSPLISDKLNVVLPDDVIAYSGKPATVNLKTAPVSTAAVKDSPLISDKLNVVLPDDVIAYSGKPTTVSLKTAPASTAAVKDSPLISDKLNVVLPDDMISYSGKPATVNLKAAPKTTAAVKDSPLISDKLNVVLPDDVIAYSGKPATASLKTAPKPTAAKPTAASAPAQTTSDAIPNITDDILSDVVSKKTSKIGTVIEKVSTEPKALIPFIIAGKNITIDNLNDAQNAAYDVVKYVNPSDEDIVQIREIKTDWLHSTFDNMIADSKADAAESLIKGGFGSTLNAAGSVASAALLTGIRDTGIGIVSEAKSEEERKQSTYNLQTGIADTLKSGFNPINDVLGKGIEMSRDYQYYGLIGENGKINPPGLLEVAGLGLVGGAIAPVIAAEGGLSIPTAATLKSILTGTTTAAPVEGMTAAQAIGKDVLFSGGRAAAGTATAVRNSNAKVNAAGLFTMEVFSDSDTISLKTDVFSDNSIAEENYPTRKDKLDDLRRIGLGGGDVFKDHVFDMESYGSRSRLSNKNEILNVYDSIFENPNPSENTNPNKYGLIGDTIFGNVNSVQFERDTRYREETRYEYDYIYDYPTGRGARRTKPRDFDWDDDDILEESTSRKKKKSRLNVWEEILEF